MSLVRIAAPGKKFRGIRFRGTLRDRAGVQSHEATTSRAIVHSTAQPFRRRAISHTTKRPDDLAIDTDAHASGIDASALSEAGNFSGLGKVYAGEAREIAPARLIDAAWRRKKGINETG